jgi:hypothetical protein
MMGLLLGAGPRPSRGRGKPNYYARASLAHLHSHVNAAAWAAPGASHAVTDTRGAIRWRLGTGEPIGHPTMMRAGTPPRGAGT